MIVWVVLVENNPQSAEVFPNKMLAQEFCSRNNIGFDKMIQGWFSTS